jgi:hypothetical protein
MRMNSALFRVLLSAVLSLNAGLIAAEPEPVPNDFKLFAQYSPGYSTWKPWKVTVTGDGKALQQIDRARSSKEEASENTSTLTQKQLQNLVTVVRASQFSGLHRKYSYAVTDMSTLTLRVTMNGTSHEVTVYAASSLKNNPEVKRFMKVWNAVLTAVPAPNPEQKPD